MKIVGIQSSSGGKHSNTLKLPNAALNRASEEGADIESIDIAKMNVEYCTACNSCHNTGVCTIKDDCEIVLKKTLAADGIVLSSSNYITKT